MLSFKELMNEVAEPKAGDEQRFKAKHIVQVIDDPHMDKETREGTKKSPSKKKRLADMEKGEDEFVYEQHMMTCEDCGEEYDADEGEHECEMNEDIVHKADVKMVKVKRPDGSVVMRKERPKIQIGKGYNEETMSDAEMKKREDIVKGMKDKEAELKKRYGDRWKSVMYATATKKAMDEAANLDEISTTKLSNYMRKSSADYRLPGASARRQDKRIGGQSMADNKIRKKEGKYSTAKVAASEETDLDEGDKVTVKPKGNSRYFTIIKTTNTKFYPIGDEISDDDISMMQSGGKVKVDIKESTELDEAVMQGSKEHLKKLQDMLDKVKPGSADHSQIRGAIESKFGKKHIPAKHRNVKPNVYEEVELDEAFKVGVLKLKDDSTVKLTNDDAQALNNLYKNLNTSNSTRMIEKLKANKKSFGEILAFAKQAM